MNKKELMTSKNPLSKLDTEDKTYGCRHTNLDICINYSLPNIFIFTSDDCICIRPPIS